MRIMHSVVLAGIASALAGCGDAEPAAKNAPPPVRLIFTSVADCQQTGKLTAEQCIAAIDRAVALHEQSGEVYKTEKLCEKTNGEGHCERTAAKSFRPRLAATMTIVSQPPVHRPLYAVVGFNGYRMPDKTRIALDDDNLVVTRRAVNEAHAGSGDEGSDADGLAASAADIH